MRLWAEKHCVNGKKGKEHVYKLWQVWQLKDDSNDGDVVDTFKTKKEVLLKYPDCKFASRDHMSCNCHPKV